MAICITCEEEYNDKRLALGYYTCLDCGESEARGIIAVTVEKKTILVRALVEKTIDIELIFMHVIRKRM